MAENNQADYSKIGFVVLLGIAAIVYTLIRIGGLRGDRQEIACETYFREPVSGLSAGSPVNFRGVKVGEVRGISFIASNYECTKEDRKIVLVRIALNPAVLNLARDADYRTLVSEMVRRGLRSTISPSGITGLSRIELNFPKRLPAEPPISWTPATPCIPSVPSVMESLTDTAERLMGQLNTMDFAVLFSNLVATTETAAGLMHDVGDLVQDHRADFETMLENAAGAATLVKELAQELRDNPSLLLRANDAPALPETSR